MENLIYGFLFILFSFLSNFLNAQEKPFDPNGYYLILDTSYLQKQVASSNAELQRFMSDARREAEGSSGRLRGSAGSRCIQTVRSYLAEKGVYFRHDSWEHYRDDLLRVRYRLGADKKFNRNCRKRITRIGEFENKSKHFGNIVGSHKSRWAFENWVNSEIDEANAEIRASHIRAREIEELQRKEKEQREKLHREEERQREEIRKNEEERLQLEEAKEEVLVDEYEHEIEASRGDGFQRLEIVASSSHDDGFQRSEVVASSSHGVVKEVFHMAKEAVVEAVTELVPRVGSVVISSAGRLLTQRVTRGRSIDDWGRGRESFELGSDISFFKGIGPNGRYIQLDREVRHDDEGYVAHLDVTYTPQEETPSREEITHGIELLENDVAILTSDVERNRYLLDHTVTQHAYNIRLTTTNTLELAKKYNENGNQEIAHALSDFTHNFLVAGKRTFVLLSAVPRGVGRGISNFSDSYRQLADKFLIDPIGFVVETNDTLRDATIHLFRAAVNAYRNPQEFLEKFRVIGAGLQEKWNSASAEDVVEASATFVTELVLHGLTFNVAGQAVVGRVNQLREVGHSARLVATSAKHELFGLAKAPVLQGVHEELARRVFTPIGTVYTDVSSLVKEAAVYGREFVSTIQKSPAFLDLGRTVGEAAELFEQAKEYWNLKGLLHTCKGNFRIADKVVRGLEQRRGLISGMHTEEAFEHFLKMCKFEVKDFGIERLPNGVTRVRIPIERFANNNAWKNARAYDAMGRLMQGVKTLWPRGYMPKDISFSAMRVLSNLGNKVPGKEHIYRGIVDGISVQVTLSKETGKIVSTFPTWVQ